MTPKFQDIQTADNHEPQMTVVAAHLRLLSYSKTVVQAEDVAASIFNAPAEIFDGNIIEEVMGYLKLGGSRNSGSVFSKTGEDCWQLTADGAAWLEFRRRSLLHYLNIDLPQLTRDEKQHYLGYFIHRVAARGTLTFGDGDAIKFWNCMNWFLLPLRRPRGSTDAGSHELSLDVVRSTMTDCEGYATEMGDERIGLIARLIGDMAAIELK
jgi:hypothetical protein